MFSDTVYYITTRRDRKGAPEQEAMVRDPAGYAWILMRLACRELQTRLPILSCPVRWNNLRPHVQKHAGTAATTPHALRTCDISRAELGGICTNQKLVRCIDNADPARAVWDVMRITAADPTSFWWMGSPLLLRKWTSPYIPEDEDSHNERPAPIPSLLSACRRLKRAFPGAI